MAIKPSTTIEEQIAILQRRGMEVDVPFASQWLNNVSYYRLSGYWYSYRLRVQNDKESHARRLDRFQDGTTFYEVAQLYEFDRKLRTLIHDGIERIEVALRAKIGNYLASIDPLAYLQKDLFRPDFRLDDWTKKAFQRVFRAEKRSPAIKHYASKYGEYPIWVMMDFLDFSDISILFDGLRSDDQHAISKSFGLDVNIEKLNAKQKKKYYNQDPLARWCEQLSVLRNICAHHGRLWNTNLTPASTSAFRTLEGLKSLPKGQSNKIFGALLLMSFLLQRISPGTQWSHKICDLINSEYLSLPHRDISELGVLAPNQSINDLLISSTE